MQVAKTKGLDFEDMFAKAVPMKLKDHSTRGKEMVMFMFYTEILNFTEAHRHESEMAT
jgi:hypothetical protein